MLSDLELAAQDLEEALRVAQDPALTRALRQVLEGLRR